MVIFNNQGGGYFNPMDKEYNSNNAISPNQEANIERPIGVQDIGQSVTEGSKFGPFRQSVNAAIRAGARRIELQTQMGGGSEPVGVESYGKHARAELREIQRANKVEFTSVHAPTQIGNVSGFQGRQGGGGDFSDDYRKVAIEEIRRAIDFAGDVTQGGAVVVHTGEYQRPMSEMWWNKDNQFLSHQEEPARAVTFMVDDRTGRVIGDIRKSQTVREPAFWKAGYKDHKDWIGREVRTKQDPNKFIILKEDDLIDKDGYYLDPDEPDDLFWRVPYYNPEGTRFESIELGWDDFVTRAKQYNERHKDKIEQGLDRAKSPEDMFFRTQLETQIMQYRGSSLYHGRFYVEQKRGLDKMKEALVYYEELEKDISEEEKWKIMKDRYPSRMGYAQEYIKADQMTPAEFLKKEIEDTELELKYTREASSAADAQADAQLDTLRHVVPVGVYALKQSTKSYAELGIHAMQQTEVNPHVKKDIFVAPENLFPEMGYGSHPEELIELIQMSRKHMVKLLTQKKIEDPTGKKISQKEAQDMGRADLIGKTMMVDNDYYQPGTTKEQAWEEAQQHIKATFDTQHLAMWRKHFQPTYRHDLGRIETKQETDGRFKEWYMEQVENMHKAGIIGNIHLVDAMGSAHHHLPAGQGDMPVVEAVKYLRNHGYDGLITSEGHGEEIMQQGRILTETWRAFGTEIAAYGATQSGGGDNGLNSWDNIHQSYFGQNQAPYYVFGSYAPSNDWTLWTQTPLE